VWVHMIWVSELHGYGCSCHGPGDRVGLGMPSAGTGCHGSSYYDRDVWLCHVPGIWVRADSVTRRLFVDRSHHYV
jgi:hypothetical protein